MPHPKDDPKSPEWRPYIFARDQWHCRICGDRFLYSADAAFFGLRNSEIAPDMLRPIKTEDGLWRKFWPTLQRPQSLQALQTGQLTQRL
jgi:hypothetical protein